MQTASDHQVKNQPEVVIYSNCDTFANPPQCAHASSFNTRNRRFYGTQEKGTCQPHLLDRLADNTRLKRSDISSDVGKLGHALQLARRSCSLATWQLELSSVAVSEFAKPVS